MAAELIVTREDPPPLRLAHLLLFMAVCSIFLLVATSPQLAGPPRDLREAADWRYRRIITVPTAMLNAANTTVVILLVVWTWRCRRVWNQPGHWMALWWLWQMISPWCEVQLYSLTKWLAGVDTTDEIIQFWALGKGIHVLRSLPFGLLFFALAFGWRGVANTWLWRIYFASTAIWLLSSATVAHLPFNWPQVVRAAIPDAINRFVIYQYWQLSHVLLLLAMLYDLLPGRPRRHWSHWTAACNPLLTHLLRYLPPYVWDFLHPSR
ncbi:MAG: hypothetical protein L0228_08800 [Planctomycetes bacterium]|nr:hypothetical protein [Planctomycetota bacterium]